MSTPLNDREKEIVTAMADGLTAKEISRKIGVERVDLLADFFFFIGSPT